MWLQAVAVTHPANKLLVLGNTAGDSAYPSGWTNGSSPGLLTFGVVTTGAGYTASAVDALVASGATSASVLRRSDNAFAADIADGLMATLSAHPDIGAALDDPMVTIQWSPSNGHHRPPRLPYNQSSNSCPRFATQRCSVPRTSPAG